MGNEVRKIALMHSPGWQWAWNVILRMVIAINSYLVISFTLNILNSVIPEYQGSLPYQEMLRHLGVIITPNIQAPVIKKKRKEKRERKGRELMSWLYHHPENHQLK